MSEIEEVKNEEEKLTTETLSRLVEGKKVADLRELFLTTQDADIAQAANELDVKELIFIFRSVPSTSTATFFDYLSQEAKEKLVGALSDKELVKVINEQSADDVTDFVGEMPANLASRVLSAASKDMREDINQLLNYKDHTAGSIMTTEFLEFKDSMGVDEAIEEIRRRGKDAETIYTIFVRDAQRDFVGTVDLDDLIFAKKDQKLSDIMNRDVVSCLTSDDQEEVAKMFRKYDLTAMAVLNDDHKLVGLITIDDAIDVLTEETTEDIHKMAAISGEATSYLDNSAWSNARKCIPWIIVLLILGTFSSLVLSIFEEKLAAMAILAAFMPTIMGTAGNSGGQSSALMIRSLALNEFGPKDYLKILWREIKSSLIVAIIVSAFAFLWVMIEQYFGIVSTGNGSIWRGDCWTSEFFLEACKVSSLIALTMFCCIIVSKIVGTCIPLTAAALKKDPALLSQPILTTVMDVISLLIYFGLAVLIFSLV